MEIPLLKEIVIILGLSILVLFICTRLRIPTIVGFIITGILAGPHGQGLVKASQEVETLAEVGVILLLFTIGIEFSLKNLLQIKKAVLMGGALQVLLTILAVFLIVKQFGLPVGQSIFIGFLVALSSTAIVLKLLQERAEVDSPYGRTTLGILIFQDIIIVPMMLFTPLLTGATGNFDESSFLLVAKGIGIVLLIIISAKWIVPQLLYQIARTRSRELFLLGVVVICLAIAWLTSRAGLSLALGAFLAGLIISESEYSHQALGNVLPFRDVFTSFFFISIGMLLDVSFIFQQPGVILLCALGVLLLKSLLAGFVSALLGLSLRVAILVGLALSQVGEFSFILSKTGLEYELFSGNVYQLFLAVSVLTMAVTPFIITFAPHIAEIASKLPLPQKIRGEIYFRWEEVIESKKNHIIIIGFGINGRNVARASKIAGIPYIIVEMNPDTVRDEKAEGEPIYFGDATQEAVLQRVNIKGAKVIVIAISDPIATRRITVIARRCNPNVYIITRTRYIQEMKPLYELGANEVIPEEFETSVEIFTRVLRAYLIPEDEIEKFVAEVRSDGYEMFRSLAREPAAISDLKLHLPDVEITAFRVSGKSPLAGKSLAQIDLRKKYGITLLAIRRSSQVLPNPGGETQLYANDLLIVLGQPERIAEASSLFRNSGGEEKK